MRWRKKLFHRFRLKLSKQLMGVFYNLYCPISVLETVLLFSQQFFNLESYSYVYSPICLSFIVTNSDP